VCKYRIIITKLPVFFDVFNKQTYWELMWLVTIQQADREENKMSLLFLESHATKAFTFILVKACTYYITYNVICRLLKFLQSGNIYVYAENHSCVKRQSCLALKWCRFRISASKPTMYTADFCAIPQRSLVHYRQESNERLYL